VRKNWLVFQMYYLTTLLIAKIIQYRRYVSECGVALTVAVTWYCTAQPLRGLSGD